MQTQEGHRAEAVHRPLRGQRDILAIGISCTLEGLGVWSSLETMVMAWAKDEEGVGRQSTGIFQEIFMETSFELKYIWGKLCRAHLFFISHSFTCLILCMNKQAEYITNNYKIKSVNWVIRKILQVTGRKIKINEPPHPHQNMCQGHSSFLGNVGWIWI